ncbi:MAG: DUF6600 domain-containing protein, partial [Acidobacteriota bacterium]
MVSKPFLVVAALLSTLTGNAFSQDLAAQQAPVNLAYLEGSVDVVHEGVAERADASMLLVEGDVVRTLAGRAELVYPDGTVIHLDRTTTFEILGPSRVRLTSGRAIVRVSAASPQPFAVDTPAAVVSLDPRGEYLVETDDARRDLEVSVTRGSAEVDDGSQRALVRGGERLTLAGAGARPSHQAFNSARWDAFERWSYQRNDGFAGAVSASRVPPALRAYGPVLDRHGRWDCLAPHGYVWYPSVAASWRPYFAGAWGHTRFGWTWYGSDFWTWPTHHYGRWGHSGAAWYWIPGSVWGPAWVSWGFAPGYVSWSPLGWNTGPSRWPRDHPAYRPNPWQGWTIVPRDHFRPKRPVWRHAVDGDRLDDVVRRTVIVQQEAPPAPYGVGVPRGTLSVAGPNRSLSQSPSSRPGSVRRPSLSPNDPGERPMPAPRTSGRVLDDPALAPVPGRPSPAPTTPEATPRTRLGREDPPDGRSRRLGAEPVERERPVGAGRVEERPRDERPGGRGMTGAAPIEAPRAGGRVRDRGAEPQDGARRPG